MEAAILDLTVENIHWKLLILELYTGIFYIFTILFTFWIYMYLFVTDLYMDFTWNRKTYTDLYTDLYMGF